MFSFLKRTTYPMSAFGVGMRLQDTVTHLAIAVLKETHQSTYYAQLSQKKQQNLRNEIYNVFGQCCPVIV